VRRPRSLVALLLVAALAGPVSTATAAWAAEPDPSSTSSSTVGVVIPGEGSPGTDTDAAPGGASGGTSGGGTRTGTGRGTGTGGGEQLATLAESCISSSTEPTAAPTPAASPAATLRLDVTSAAQGGEVVATGEGFQPGEQVLFTLYSSPAKLGSFTARSNGQVIGRVTIPERTQLGTHTIQALGYLDCRTENAVVEVVSPSGNGSSIFPWIVWIIVGGGLVLALIGYVVGAAAGVFPRLFGSRPVPEAQT
jgi:hypothetical protein